MLLLHNFQMLRIEEHAVLLDKFGGIQIRLLSLKRELTLLTDGEPLELSITEDGRVFAGLAAPRFSPAEVPFSAAEKASQYPIDVQGQSLSIGARSMGNPHAILMVDDCDRAPVQTLGPLLESVSVVAASPVSKHFPVLLRFRSYSETNSLIPGLSRQPRPPG